LETFGASGVLASVVSSVGRMAGAAIVGERAGLRGAVVRRDSRLEIEMRTEIDY
jgi:hypothetical protein